MSTHRGGSVRQQKIAVYLTLVFVSTAAVVFALSFLPWFGHLTGTTGPRNPYDLLSLERMDRDDREQLVESWAEDWERLDEEEQADRADLFLDSMVDYMEEKLDLDRGQKVETKSLVKSAVLVANQAGLRDEDFPNRGEATEKLREQVREQVDAILTPEQREKFANLLEERREEQRREQEERKQESEDGS